MRLHYSSATRLTLLMFAFLAMAVTVAVMPQGSVSTYGALSVLVLALVLITVNTASNAQPTGSFGQLVYATEHAPTVASRHDDRMKAAPVERW